MFQNEFYEKKELKRYSITVGWILLFAYFSEQILSNILIYVYEFLGYSSNEIRNVLLDPWSGYLYNTLIVSVICVLPFCFLKFINKKPIHEIASFNSPAKGNVLLCVGFAFGFSMIALLAVMLILTALTNTVFAAGDPLATINNLSTFIFSAIKAIGLILLGFGIVQIGLSLKSHDASQRANGFLTFFGGVIIAFAKDILDMII